MSRHDRKGHLPPFVPLLKATLASPAWRAMSHGARSLYVSLKARYNSGQHNNGRVFVSQRTASQEIGSSYAEIARWFRELQYYGFLVQTKGGSLGLNGKGTAPHWRLTECGYMNDPPTRDFGRWDGTKFKDCVSRRRRPKAQNPVAENRNTPLRKTATPALRKTATWLSPPVLRKTATYLVYHSPALKKTSGSIWTFLPVCVGGCDAPLRTFTDMTDEDDEQMRIVFEDGTSEDTAAVFHPAQRIPKHLKRVWDNLLPMPT